MGTGVRRLKWGTEMRFKKKLDYKNMYMTTFIHLKSYTWNILKNKLLVNIKGLGNDTRNLHTSIIHQWKLEVKAGSKSPKAIYSHSEKVFFLTF